MSLEGIDNLELIGGAVGVVLGLVGYVVFLRSFKRVRPGEALIVYGGQAGRPPRVLLAGGVLVVPILQKAERLNLQPVNLSLRDVGGLTRDGQRFVLDASAQVRILAEQEAVLIAAERFLGAPPGELEKVVAAVLEGHLRLYVASLDSEGAARWHQELGELVQQAAGDDLKALGMDLMGFQIQDLRARG